MSYPTGFNIEERTCFSQLISYHYYKILLENPNIGEQKIKKIWDKNYRQFLSQFCSEDHTEFKNAIKAFSKQKITGMNATELKMKTAFELS